MLQANSKFRSFLSTSIGRPVKIHRFGIENSMQSAKEEIIGAPLKICSGPENKNAPISLGGHAASQ